MPDGSQIYLKKLAADYDPTSREHALRVIHEARSERKLITGLLYVEPDLPSFEQELKLVETPLARLPLEQVRPPRRVLEEIMEELRTGKGASGGS